MRLRPIYAFILAAGILCSAGCEQTDTVTQEKSQEASAFLFDEAAFPGARPWTSENFRNDPADFQFAIIGDRTGGANVLGTFELGMDQLNLLQPEFVINVGDIIEGYAEDRAELIGMWEEAEVVTGKLQMPFFYTRGNHDVSYPGGKEMWLERRGPNYYHFVYRDV